MDDIKAQSQNHLLQKKERQALEKQMNAERSEEIRRQKAEAKARADADAAVALAAKQEAEAQLKFESDLAKEAIAAKPVTLPNALAQLAAKCTSAEHAMGGLLVLTQLHPASSLFAPLVASLASRPRLPDGGALRPLRRQPGLPQAAPTGRLSLVLRGAAHAHGLPQLHRSRAAVPGGGLRARGGGGAGEVPRCPSGAHGQ